MGMPRAFPSERAPARVECPSGGRGVVFFEARGHRTSRGAPLGHLIRAAAGPGTFGGAKDSLPDGRDRNAGTGVPWDDGGSVLRQYGEDTKLDLKNSSWQQRIFDSDWSRSSTWYVKLWRKNRHRPVTFLKKIEPRLKKNMYAYASMLTYSRPYGSTRQQGASRSQE